MELLSKQSAALTGGRVTRPSSFVSTHLTRVLTAGYTSVAALRRDSFKSKGVINLIERVHRDNGTRPAERLAPWTPFRELFGFDPFDGLTSHSSDYNVARTEAGYEIEIPIPGFKADQIEVTFKDGVLTTSGRNDRRVFSRSLTVPDDVDAEAIGAHVEDGILTLTLSRRPEAQPKRIAITSK